MEAQSFGANTGLLLHPFYKQEIGAWGGRPRRSMLEVDAKGCFIWQGCFNSKGYPTRGQMLAHRLAWIAFFGPIPDGRQIHHECGDKRCINIHHLRCLTPEEHRAIEGRPPKLDATKVRQILRLIVAGVPRRAVASQFGIARHYLTDIKKARVWKQVVGDFWREQGLCRAGADRELRRAA